MRTRQSQTFFIIIFSLLAIGLVALALGGYLAPVSRVLLSPYISAQTWLSSRYQAFESFFTAPQDLARLRQRNVELEAEVSRLQTEIIDLQQQIAETRILSALVDFARVNPEYSYVAAAVIGRDPSPFVKYVILNRGSDDGLRRGMPVVTQQGLVGRISAVTAGAARVQLITDPSSSINVRLEPSRASAVLLGDVTGELALDMIPQEASIQIGDVVLTSGLGGDYPADILVGQIASVRRQETDIFQRGVVQPVVNFNGLEIVLIIINFRPVEIGPLIPTPGTP
jgi:rod shape-determining protein MreC